MELAANNAYLVLSQDKEKIKREEERTIGAVKNIFDRCNGVSTPFSTYRGRQMHHTLRYGRHDLFKVYVYGDISKEEKVTFQYMAKRNAINYGYKNSEFVVLSSLSELEGLI